MSETITGIAAAIVIIMLARALAKIVSQRFFAATILVAIAFIYVGFSLKDNSVGSIVLESVIAVVLYFMAVVGYARNSLLLAYGIIFHGIWDILHHNGLAIHTDVPVYWPPFCFVVDIIDGLYFVIIFMSQKKQASNPPAAGNA